MGSTGDRPGKVESAGMSASGSTRATGEREVPFGALHRPEGALSCPGVVVIHDVWGRSPHSRTLARGLAGAGFAALELDLYRRMADPRVSEPGERIRSLDDAAVLADLDAAADWLAGEAICRGRRIGVLGVCMGGTYALLAACSSTRFAASTPFYGLVDYDHGLHLGPDGRDRVRKPASPIERAAGLRMPLLAAFADEDHFIPPDQVDRFEAAVAKSGVEHHIDRYAGAGHAFLNETRADAHRPEAAARALARAYAFLHAQLD
jgi:carboxymethylenebutenolidase